MSSEQELKPQSPNPLKKVEMIAPIIKLIAAAATAATAATINLRDCSSESAKFSVTDLVFKPSSPVAGEPVSLTLGFEAPAGTYITGGTATTKTTFNFIPLAPSSSDLCSNVQCPITGGAHTNTTITTWPSGMTAGSFNSKTTWTDLGGSELLCMEMYGRV
jgi:hypothetical protein